MWGRSKTNQISLLHFDERQREEDYMSDHDQEENVGMYLAG